MDRTPIEVKKKLSQEALYDFYQRMLAVPHAISSDVVFTFDTRKADDIQSLKLLCMQHVIHRLKNSRGLIGAILTRENHKSGVPHIHAMVWYRPDCNNAPLLTGCPDYEVVRGKRKYGRKCGCPLGRVSVYSPIRMEPYVQQCTGKRYQSSYDYMIKDQDIPWKEPNAIILNPSISVYLDQPKNNFVD